MTKRPEPVMASAGLAALLVVLVNSLVVMLTALGYLDWSETQQAAVNGFVVALINVFAVVLPMMAARNKVTPVADPQTDTGQALKTASQWEDERQQERRRAAMSRQVAK